MQLCARLKADPYTAIVPLAAVAGRHVTDRVQAWFAAGADEVLTPLFEPVEQAGRLDGLVARAERDVAVNPSTRLPGTTEIERDIRRRMEDGEQFAVCYADWITSRSSTIATATMTATGSSTSCRGSCTTSSGGCWGRRGSSATSGR